MSATPGSFGRELAGPKRRVHEFMYVWQKRTAAKITEANYRVRGWRPIAPAQY
jgi:hypothetical protein